MLYSTVRPIATVGIRVFYRKIHLSNVAHIPRNKPVILAANHPTGFMEPCVLACHLDRPLYFLVRGDLFKEGLYNFLLRSLHMLPVYRARDRGYAYVKNNYETFDFCYDALRENKTLMILAEGRAEHEKRLRPLQKGTARIAFGALERYPELEDVYIVPVGVNYTYAEHPRSEIFIDFGEPLKARDYFDAFRENPNQTASDFTEELRQRMLERIIIIEKEDDDELTEYLLQMDRSHRPAPIFPIVSNTREPLVYEKSVADRVNELDPTKKLSLLSSARQYFQQLQTAGITDAELLCGGVSLWAILFLLLGLPLFAVGYLFNVLPVLLGKRIADKRVRRPEFYAPVFWAVAMGAYLIWLILWLIGLVILATPVLLFWLILMPLLGYFAMLYLEFYKKMRRKTRAKRLKKEQRSELLKMRETIMAEFGK